MAMAEADAEDNAREMRSLKDDGRSGRWERRGKEGKEKNTSGVEYFITQIGVEGAARHRIPGSRGPMEGRSTPVRTSTTSWWGSRCHVRQEYTTYIKDPEVAKKTLHQIHRNCNNDQGVSSDQERLPPQDRRPNAYRPAVTQDRHQPNGGPWIQSLTTIIQRKATRMGYIHGSSGVARAHDKDHECRRDGLRVRGIQTHDSPSALVL